ncbi:Hint domain-containing protein [Acetobacter pasteurianus]
MTALPRHAVVHDIHDKSDQTLPDGASARHPDTSVPGVLHNTNIHTQSGPQPVQSLTPGHVLVTYDPEMAEMPAPITKVMAQHVCVLPGLPEDEAGYPIRVLQDAIADGLPTQDVLLTPDQCLFFENKFVPAALLVNRLSIFYDHTFERYIAYPLETDGPAIIVAEGLLVASALPPCPNNTHWHTRTDAPVVTEREVVGALYHRLLARAKSRGLSHNLFEPPEITHEHDLSLITDTGKLIRKMREQNNLAMFMLPPNVHEVHLSSRASRPVDVIAPYVQDKRRLGVRVGEITLQENRKPRKISSHMEKDLPGWHEHDGEPGRWTDGHAHLPMTSERSKNKMGLLSIQILDTIPYMTHDFHGPRKNHK